MTLTTEEFFLFEHNGYFRVPGALSPELVQEVKATIRRHAEERIEPIVCEDPERPGYGKAGDIPGANVLRLSKILARHEAFRSAARSPKLIGVLRALLGLDVDVVLNRHNHATLRPPGAAQLEWHRDVSNWSRPIVSAVFYLEDSTIENGCTWVLPGSHHMLFYHAGLQGHGRLDTLQKLGVQIVPVPSQAGDVLLMNGLVIHGAGANRSDETRMSMTLGYHAVDELGSAEESQKALVAGERVLRHN